MNRRVDQNKDLHLHWESDLDSKANVLWLNDCQGVLGEVAQCNGHLSNFFNDWKSKCLTTKMKRYRSQLDIIRHG